MMGVFSSWFGRSLEEEDDESRSEFLTPKKSRFGSKSRRRAVVEEAPELTFREAWTGDPGGKTTKVPGQRHRRRWTFPILSRILGRNRVSKGTASRMRMKKLGFRSSSYSSAGTASRRRQSKGQEKNNHGENVCV